MGTSVLRRRLARLFARLVCGLSLVLALGAVALPASAHGSVTSYPGVLNGVSAVSPSDAWAVGHYCPSGCNTGQLTLILHWNGTAWIKVAAPHQMDGSLSAVRTRSPSGAWAVGSSCASPCTIGSADARTLILHWNGHAWAKVSSPTPRGADVASLQGVSVVSPSSAWAVGYYCLTGHCQPLILHWNGSAWSRVASPDLAHGGALDAVRVLSASDAWAVGFYDTKHSYSQSLALRWNGTKWDRVPVPSPSHAVGPENSLSGLSVLSGSDIWARYFASPLVAFLEEIMPMIFAWVCPPRP